MLNELRQRTTELSEALEQQTATSEVLQVVNSSPGDLEPVFASMLEKAVRICDATFGNIYRWDGEALHLLAAHDTPPALLEARKRLPRRAATSFLRRMLATKMADHVADLTANNEYTEERLPGAVTAAELGGVRTFLAVPMLHENELIGSFSLYRQEVRPFSDKQIALVTNFAAQAVIAIENARLLNELRQRTTDLTERTADLTEALEQQTATSDVLQVISRSPGDLEPVFASMLEKAVRICDATFGNIYRWDGEFLNLVAAHNSPPAFAEARRSPRRPDPKMPAGRMLSTKAAIHVVDLAADQSYIEQRIPEVIAAVELGGVRTFLAVPMLKDNELIGALSLSRQEVHPFIDKQIELVKNFAAQAVIAIENARLLNELRQSLEQQTATSEVLGIISSSPGDLEPVFASMLENAVRVCDAKFGNIYRWDGEALHLLASHNTPPAFAEARKRSPRRPGPNTPAGRMVATNTVVHVADLAAEQAFVEQRDPATVAAVELGGVRTFLAVPMLKENELIGTFALARQEVHPFTDKQIALVTNFAAQAVIAIENARLLNELRQRTTDLTEALEQQTATSQVLQVISGSSGDLKPVFHAILANAVRICEANFGTLLLYDGSEFRLVAAHNPPPAFAELRRRQPEVRSSGVLARLVATKQLQHVPDCTEDASYKQDDLDFVQFVELCGARTFLGAPMLKENELIGVIGIHRQEVRAFTDKQIELISNFAAQAVIAIENARLLNELRQRTNDLTERTADLTEALEQQTATSEVLQVISGSPGDLEPVFETMLENAVRICDAKFGNIYRWDDDLLHLIAMHNTPPAFAEARRRSPHRRVDMNRAATRMLETKAPVQVIDAAAQPGYLDRSDLAVVEAVELGGVRTLLGVPMLKENELIGAFTLYRQEVRPFTDKQIALVTNFAAQAVIAIENARLLNELQQSLERQTATSEVLQVISTSPSDLEPVFATMLGKAVSICDAKFGTLYLREGDELRLIATHDVPPAFVEAQRYTPFRPAPEGMLDAVMKTGTTVHLADLAETRSYIERDPRMVDAVEVGGIRTVVGVPLLKDNELIGLIGIYRQEVRPFAEKQIALLTNFAAQAVIAIENARLLNELRERTTDLTERTADLTEALEQQTATSEMLRIISSSPGDLEAVFHKMLENATRICDATFGNIYRWDGEALRLVATHDTPPAFAEARRRSAFYRDDKNRIVTSIFATKTPVHVVDAAAEPGYLDRSDLATVQLVELGGVRTLLAVPHVEGR